MISPGANSRSGPLAKCFAVSIWVPSSTGNNWWPRVLMTLIGTVFAGSSRSSVSRILHAVSGASIGKQEALALARLIILERRADVVCSASRVLASLVSWRRKTVVVDLIERRKEAYRKRRIVETSN